MCKGFLANIVSSQGLDSQDFESRVSNPIREFTKGGLVKGGLAMRHVFNFHIQNEPDALQLHKADA